MPKTFGFCVRSRRVPPPGETKDCQDSRTGAASRRGRARRVRRRAPGHPRRAARVHAHTSRPGARRQSLDLHPASAAAHRDRRHAMGHAADSSRRTRATNRPTTTSSSSSSARAGQSGPARCYFATDGRADPSSAWRGQDVGADRSRPEHRPDSDRARRLAMVAVDGTRRRRPRVRVRLAAAAARGVRTRGARRSYELKMSAKRAWTGQTLLEAECVRATRQRRRCSEQRPCRS